MTSRIRRLAVPPRWATIISALRIPLILHVALVARWTAGWRSGVRAPSAWTPSPVRALAFVLGWRRGCWCLSRGRRRGFRLRRRLRRNVRAAHGRRGGGWYNYDIAGRGRRRGRSLGLFNPVDAVRHVDVARRAWSSELAVVPGRHLVLERAGHTSVKLLSVGEHVPVTRRDICRGGQHGWSDDRIAGQLVGCERRVRLDDHVGTLHVELDRRVHVECVPLPSDHSMACGQPTGEVDRIVLLGELSAVRNIGNLEEPRIPLRVANAVYCSIT